MTVTGFFYNPNIHPFREFERRIEAMESVSRHFDLPMVWHEGGYRPFDWFEAVGPDPSRADRCVHCYRLRLGKAARKAADLGMTGYTTTLLSSPYQRHELIRAVGEELAASQGIRFYSLDFRTGWAEGAAASRKMGIYMQPYCGCLFSEAERYAKRADRLRERLASSAP